MSDEELLEFMEDEGPVLPEYTAKSVIIDAADDYGLGVIAFREMDFWYKGSRLALVFADMASFGQSTFAGGGFLARYAFDTSTATIGANANATWISNSQPTFQRIWVKWTTPIVFDRIDIINYHDNGGVTTAGMQNVVVSTTEDTSDPSSVYNAAITGGVPIYTGVFRKHISANVPDYETLTLNP